MGARGPKPKPNTLKVLAGTYRPDRAAKNEPKPQAPMEIPKPPAYFDSVAKKEWKRLAPELIRLGLLTVADLATFETYCLSYSRLVAAQKSLRKAKELTYEYVNKAGAKNIVPRPEIAIIQKESIIIKTLCAEFGCTPSARSRMEAPVIGSVGTPGNNDPHKDSFERYLNGPRKRDLSSS